jgi:hypothetical protein
MAYAKIEMWRDYNTEFLTELRVNYGEHNA